MSTGGKKYVIEFSLGGTGKKDLDEILKKFEQLNKTTSVKLNKGVQDFSQKVTSAGKATSDFPDNMERGLFQAAASLKVFDHLEETGKKFTEIGMMGFEAFGKGLEYLVEQGSELESMWLRIQSTGKTGEEARKMMDASLKFVRELPITEGDAVRILTTLSTAGIDALQQFGGTYEELHKKGQTIPDLNKLMGVDDFIKKGPNAMSLFSDMLAATGNLGKAYQNMAIHEMALFVETGAARSIRTFGPMTAEIRALGKHAKTAQDRLKGMMDILAKHHALGVSQAAMNTWAGVMSLFKGLGTRVADAIMRPGTTDGLMTKLTMAFKDVYKSIDEFLDTDTEKGKKFLAMLRDVTGWVIDRLIGAMQLLTSVAKKAFQFAADHPLLMKAAVALTLIGSALLVLVGAFLTAVGAIGGFMALFAAIPAGVLPAAAAIIAVAAGVIALVGALGALASYAFDNDFGGIKTFFSDVMLIIDAVSEAWTNWEGLTTSTTEETAKKLEEAGLMGFFLQIISFMRKVEVEWQGFIAQFHSDYAQRIADSFGKAFDRMSEAVGRVGTAIKTILIALRVIPDTSSESMGSAMNDGAKLANVLLDVANFIAECANKFAAMADRVIPSTGEMIRLFSYFYEQVILVKNAFDLVGDAVMFGLVHPLMTAVELIEAVARAAMALKNMDFKTAAGLGGDISGILGHGLNRQLGDISDMQGEFGDISEGKREGEKMRSAADRVSAGQPIGDMYGPSAVAAGVAPFSEGVASSKVTEGEGRVAGGMERGAQGPIQINHTTELKLDGDVIAREVSKRMVEQNERGGFRETGGP